MHDCGRTGPRADATVRSTSLPKIDVLSARSTETASGERDRVTDELQPPKAANGRELGRRAAGRVVTGIPLRYART